MKRIFTIILFSAWLVFLSGVWAGCTDGSGPEPSGTLLQYQGCKESKGGCEDCLEYSYDGQKLILKHINAGFNCCPGHINADIAVNGRIISITESEQEAGCFCLCLFDLDIEVSNLKPGEYTILVYEPYIDDEDEPLEFTVQLISGTSGRYCLQRNYYPWTD
jgi:hypothetical protein